MSKADAVRWAGAALAILFGVLVWAALCLRDRRRRNRGEER